MHARCRVAREILAEASETSSDLIFVGSLGGAGDEEMFPIQRALGDRLLENFDQPAEPNSPTRLMLSAGEVLDSVTGEFRAHGPWYTVDLGIPKTH